MTKARKHDALLMLFSFFTTFTNIQKKAKNLRKFFPISKFTKLVNLLVLETQGRIPVPKPAPQVAN